MGIRNDAANERHGLRRGARLAWRRLGTPEDGAVTVNWVALTAAVLSISGAVLSTVTVATEKKAAQIQQTMRGTNGN